MKRLCAVSVVVITVLLLMILPACALQISQIEFDLHIPAGSSGTYSFQVINNESDPQEIIVYLSDWTRTVREITISFPSTGPVGSSPARSAPTKRWRSSTGLPSPPPT